MKRNAGFTLIDVMATLAVIVILAALTLPSLGQYVVKSKRAQAQAALLQLMQQQERYYSQNNSYVAFSSSSTDVPATLFKWWSGHTAAASAYELRALACADEAIIDCVQLSAIPGTVKVDQNFGDGDCGTLTLNSRGERAASGAAAHCWP